MGRHRRNRHAPPPPAQHRSSRPTFNRAPLVIRALNSVAAQGYRDFEIVLVDDGSSDETLVAVRRWSTLAGQPVNTVWQPNAGVHAAYNTGVATATSELIVVLGSDDQLLPDALARMAKGWTSIPASLRHRYCALVGHGLDWRNGRRVGDPFPTDVFDSTDLNITRDLHIRGDKPGAYRRDVLLEYPFPVFPDEHFMREAYVLKQLSHRYRTRFVNQAFQGAETGSFSFTPKSGCATSKEKRHGCIRTSPFRRPVCPAS